MITSNRDVVETLVAELTEHGTLDAEQIDATIIDAIAARSARQESARRVDWLRRIEGARAFEEFCR